MPRIGTQDILTTGINRLLLALEIWIWDYMFFFQCISLGFYMMFWRVYDGFHCVIHAIMTMFLAWLSVQFIVVLSFITVSGKVNILHGWFGLFFCTWTDKAFRWKERDMLRLNTVNYRHNKVALCFYNYFLHLSFPALSLCGLHISPIPPNDTPPRT